MKLVNFMKLAVVAISLIFVSCSKDMASEPVVSEQEMITTEQMHLDLQKINNKYTDNVNRATFKYWCGVAVADLGAGWLGCQAGASFGPWGVGIGGVVMAGMGSYAAGSIEDHGDEFEESVALYDVSYELDNPNQNPYDIPVGQRHNEILKDLILADETQYLNFQQLWESEINLSSSELQVYTSATTDFIDGYNAYANVIDPSVSSFNQVSSSMISDIYLKQLLTDYSSGLEGLNFSDLLSFTEDYESYVNAAAISIETRNSALAGLSIAKYSSTFWYHNL